MPEQKSSSTGIGGKILKGIGIVTAIISLVLGIRQVVTIVQDSAARKSKAAELKAEALQLESSGMYSNAWETISQAVDVEPDYRETQVEIAMAWLRNARVSPGQKERTFTEIVNKLGPVLRRAIDTTRKHYTATIRAHIGWATFLLFKEGDRSVRVADHFRSALELDSTNSYAHAMYGFWMLFPGHNSGSMDEANRHFSIALRNRPETKFVRSLMLSAYRNMQTPKYQAQIIKLVHDMRKNQEDIELSERGRIASEAYYMYRREIVDEVGKVMTAREHLDTFLYLTDGIDVDAKPYLKETLATLREANHN